MALHRSVQIFSWNFKPKASNALLLKYLSTIDSFSWLAGTKPWIINFRFLIFSYSFSPKSTFSTSLKIS
ncbi:17742_t:CDS:1, partial [Gigaspora rosea]